MPLSSKVTIKLRASDTVREGLLYAIPEILEPHLFFTEVLMDNPRFREMIFEGVQISDGMEKAFDDKNLLRFERYLEDFSERLYDWYSENYELALAL